VLFNLILGIVNKIFRCAAALFDSAPRREKSIFELINGSFLHTFDFGS